MSTWLITGGPGSAPRVLAAERPDTMVVEQPEVVVSATRTRRSAVDVPGSTSVITGAEMRRRGIRTMAEALQDLTGIDTGEGSDNGSRLPNVGMWGLKEFDALLFTINGVPAGGPFNPSLSQIPIENVERMEILKGPQGTMYGVSAFAGMISVFTNDAKAGGEVAAGAGAFGQGQGHFSWGRSFPEDRMLQITGSFARSDGFQDRTENNTFRGGATLGFGLGKSRNTLDLVGYDDEQDWGTPLPYDQGEVVPGFKVDRNYAITGAEAKHRVFGGTLRTQLPLGEPYRIESTLGLTSDAQDFLRSFPRADEVVGDTLPSTALELDPTETSLYEDLRLVSRFAGAGTHEAVFGAALTWGKTKGEAHEVEFDQLLSRYPEIPSLPDTGDFRDFVDTRTFFGLYAHDAWTFHPRLTIEGGARLDVTSEELETEQDQPTGPTKAKDSREDSDVSGDISALVRLLPAGGAKRIQTLNLYGSFRRGFKPAAPNLAEAEAAEILEPEHTTSWEVGLKSRATGEVAVDLSYFDMTFEDLVVSILGPGGGPELTNAGKERFKGFEADLRWAPKAVAGSSIEVGYAHHDAKFVDFTFATPSGTVDVSGKHLEMVPQDLVNTRVNLHVPAGVGLWAALRYQGERPFNRRNTFFADPYTEWDVGASWDRSRWRVSVVGRNLTDDRHVVTESEIGDSQFYVAPPARVTAEIAYRF